MGKDKDDGQKRLIGSKDVENSESTGLYNYLYEGPQVFLNSDKITFNTRKESMFLSSFRNLILGAGNTIEIVSLKYSI